MDKTAIRNFAIWARNKLISDVAYRAGLMGITADGIADKLPQSTNSVQFYDIGTSEPYKITGNKIAQRSNLANLIKHKAKSSDYATAYTSIIEEVAYTWFNRLIAVRFMEVNDYLPSHIRALSSENGKIEPDIVTNPFDADLGLTDTESSKILEFKQNNESDELFKLLFIKQCNKLSEILPRLFEKTDDYTELLFNCSYVDQEGIVYRLTHDIPEEDFDIERGGQVEIIGWLYQYYNAELKDDTFALLKKNVKITKERIPSATQLFTPDWIVRYMVENSLGRLWTEGHANTSSQLRGNWKYYLEEAEQEPEVQVQLNDIRNEYAKLRPEDIKLIDPCMGSGHILVYAFDVLMQIYESEGYSQRDSAVQILENNIFGLDIDDRAAQLAYFAVMMKARQYNRRILDGTHDCHVLAIQESNGMSNLQAHLAPFGNLGDTAARLINAYNDAKEYGSILNVSLTLEEIDSLDKRLEEIINNRNEDVEEFMLEALLLNDFLPLLAQARIMVQKYDVVVTNPPYMGSNNMNPNLSAYVKEYYPDGKSDLFSVFIEVCDKMSKENGFQSMITQHSWMFLASFEELRNKILTRNTINMVHLGARAFDEISGEVVQTTSFVICKSDINGYLSRYMRLVSGVNETDKERLFLNNPELIYVFNARDAKMISGAPVAYWISERAKEDFNNTPMGNILSAKQGLATGDNERFIRVWNEIAFNKICFCARSRNDAITSHKMWFPFNKGGDYRKWYGNRSSVVNWANDGNQIRNNLDDKGKQKSRPQNINYYFRESIACSAIAADTSYRLYPEGGIPDVNLRGIYIGDSSRWYVLGLLNSIIVEVFNQILNPTLALNANDIERIPYIECAEKKEKVSLIVKECIEISKCDWDSVETSWDFKKHPLI